MIDHAQSSASRVTSHPLNQIGGLTIAAQTLHASSVPCPWAQGRLVPLPWQGEHLLAHVGLDLVVFYFWTSVHVSLPFPLLLVENKRVTSISASITFSRAAQSQTVIFPPSLISVMRTVQALPDDYAWVPKVFSYGRTRSFCCVSYRPVVQQLAQVSTCSVRELILHHETSKSRTSPNLDYPQWVNGPCKLLLQLQPMFKLWSLEYDFILRYVNAKVTEICPGLTLGRV